MNIVSNATTSKSHPLISKIKANAVRFGNIVWNDLRFKVGNNDIDKNIEKIISIFRPKIQSLMIDHGHSTHGKNILLFPRDLVDIKYFHLSKTGLKNGYGIRSVFTSLEKHSNTLESITLNEVDATIPSFGIFRKLHKLEISFSDHDFLKDVLNNPTIKTMILKSTHEFSMRNGDSSMSNVETLTIDWSGYTESLKFLEKLPKLKKVTINAPLAVHDYNLEGVEVINQVSNENSPSTPFNFSGFNPLNPSNTSLDVANPTSSQRRIVRGRRPSNR